MSSGVNAQVVDDQYWHAPGHHTPITPEFVVGPWFSAQHVVDEEGTGVGVRECVVDGFTPDAAAWFVFRAGAAVSGMAVLRPVLIGYPALM